MRWGIGNITASALGSTARTSRDAFDAVTWRGEKPRWT